MGLRSRFGWFGSVAMPGARLAPCTVAVRFGCSWMGPRPGDRLYAVTGYQVRRWFLDAPPSDSPVVDPCPFDPRRAIEDVLHLESERLAVAAPGAPSYLVASDLRPERVRFRWSGRFPWERAAVDIGWERSNCWASTDLHDPEAWLPLAPRQFTLLVLLRAAAAGQVGRDLFVRRAAELEGATVALAGDWFDEPTRAVRDLLEPRRPAQRRR